MDTPSGILPARGDRFAHRPATRIEACRRAFVTLVTLAAIGSAALATAQDELEPQPSEMARLSAHSLALDAVTADGALVAVGERGHILVSTDAGETWQQQQAPTRALLTGVYFHDRNLGWAVGHDSAILRTTDGGTTWELVNWAPEEEAPFFDVWFSDADNGIAIGAYGSYYTTSDGGVTWDFEPVGDADWHLHQIAQSANGRLYMAAEAGMAYRSDDGGSTWQELPSPYEGSFFGVLPLDDDTVLLFGLRGHLFRSEDAGETWEKIETGTVAILNSGIRLGDGTIVIAGLSGAVLISTDGGNTFELYQQANRRGISTVVDVGNGSLLMVGEFGVKTVTLDQLVAGES